MNALRLSVSLLRQHDGGESGSVPWVEVDIELVRRFVALSDVFEHPSIVVLHDDDGWALDDGIFFEEFESFEFSMGQEEDRLDADERARTHVFVGLFRQGEEVVRHISIFGVERRVLFRMLLEEDEVFRDVPCRRSDEDEDEERDDGDFCPAVRATDPAVDEEERDRREKEDERLRADGAECMRKAFVREKFGNEHDEKSRKEQRVHGELEIASLFTKSITEQFYEQGNREDEPREEKRADDGIEYRIGRIIVPPVHVSDEVVFDEREAEGLEERSGEVSAVRLGRKDRYR